MTAGDSARGCGVVVRTGVDCLLEPKEAAGVVLSVRMLATVRSMAPEALAVVVVRSVQTLATVPSTARPVAGECSREVGFDFLTRSMVVDESAGNPACKTLVTTLLPPLCGTRLLVRRGLTRPEVDATGGGEHDARMLELPGECEARGVELPSGERRLPPSAGAATDTGGARKLPPPPPFFEGAGRIMYQSCRPLVSTSAGRQRQNPGMHALRRCASWSLSQGWSHWRVFLRTA